jgi:antitoxin ParD1/3/4
MVEMSFTLSEKNKEFIEQQTAREGYSTTSEYIEKLICEDQRRQSDEYLEKLIMDGLNSGDPIPVTPEFWAEQRARLEARVKMGQVKSVNS